MQIIQDPFQHLRLSKTATSYVRRVLHRPLSEILFMRSLMQGRIRDFSISIVKNIPQNKTIIAVCCKKNKQNQGHSVEKARYAMGKKGYINV